MELLNRHRKSFSFLCFFFLVFACAIFAVFRGGDSQNAVAQVGITAESDLSSLHGTIRIFFENLSDPNKGAKKALEEILKNSPISSDEKLLDDLASRVKDINTRFGAYLSFEEIGSKSIGSDLVVIRYLYKCQNYPVVWYFTFYRPIVKTGDTALSRRWMLIGFRYDSNLDVSLRDSSF
ncbi:MAG: hypothetical protein Q4G69_14070 [Planctomycetia bacterium]|nr:hypothetical protein [Planctomycetia bacterium]